MKKWILKAIIQKTISFFPKKEKVNYLFQKYVTKGAILSDDYFELKMIHAKDHITYYNKYSNQAFNSVLELGTGWYPIIPISMFLVGFDNIVSIDTQNWLTKEKIVQTIQRFSDWKNSGQLDGFLPEINSKRWNKLLEILQKSNELSLIEIQNEFNFDFRITDARNLPFESKSFDFICSNNTFEHVDKKILSEILKEFSRLRHSTGIMSHFIDLSDHFAHFDKSISIYNFLQFSERKWKMIDNSIQPQNRLRFDDYREMYNDLKIQFIEDQVRLGDVNELKKIHLNEMYESYPIQELAISHGYFITYS